MEPFKKNPATVASKEAWRKIVYHSPANSRWDQLGWIAAPILVSKVKPKITVNTAPRVSGRFFLRKQERVRAQNHEGNLSVINPVRLLDIEG